MKLNKDIEIVVPHKAVYIESIDAMIIADLHLGLEGIAAEQGIFMPKIQFDREFEELQKILEKINPANIIIDGDMKHEFSETSYHEFVEVSRMYEFMSSTFKRVIQIKGNHDNFIIYVCKRHGVELYDSLSLGGYFFVHGHFYAEPPGDVHTIIIGHEHPAVALYDEVGGKEKVECFIYGDFKGKKLLVLPAFSYLAQGSDINLIPQHEFLSPYLKKADFEKLSVYGISSEVGVLDFGRLSSLQKVSL